MTSKRCHHAVNHPRTTICIRRYQDRGQGGKLASLMKSSSPWSHSTESIPLGIAPPALSVPLFSSLSVSLSHVKAPGLSVHI